MRQALHALRRFRQGDSGNVAIETALITPFVLLLLFGAVDVVRYLQVQDNLIRAVSTTADAIAPPAPNTAAS